MFLTIVREAPDSLSHKYWTFWLNIDYGKIELTLNSYVEEIRKTKRCKWVWDYNLKRYERLSHRDSNMKAEEVVIPQDVEAELRNNLIQQVNNAQIKRWNRNE